MLAAKSAVMVHMRWMISRDHPQVMEIEDDSFPFSWSHADLLDTLRQRAVVGVVAETGEQVLGFAVYELRTGKIELLNFAVHPSWRRMMVGGQMMDYLVRKLSFYGRKRLCLHVRESNLPMQLFLGSQGFTAVRTDRGLYEDTGEDGIRFVFHARF